MKQPNESSIKHSLKGPFPGPLPENLLISSYLPLHYNLNFNHEWKAAIMFLSLIKTLSQTRLLYRESIVAGFLINPLKLSWSYKELKEMIYNHYDQYIKNINLYRISICYVLKYSIEAVFLLLENHPFMFNFSTFWNYQLVQKNTPWPGVKSALVTADILPPRS